MFLNSVQVRNKHILVRNITTDLGSAHLEAGAEQQVLHAAQPLS